jgi:hypothetical protein
MLLSPLGRDLYPIDLHFEVHHHPENLNLLNILIQSDYWGHYWGDMRRFNLYSANLPLSDE